MENKCPACQKHFECTECSGINHRLNNLEVTVRRLAQKLYNLELEKGNITKLAKETMQEDNEFIDLPCLYCSTLIRFKITSNEAKGIFNVFCPDKDCEDLYYITL